LILADLDFSTFLQVFLEFDQSFAALLPEQLPLCICDNLLGLPVSPGSGLRALTYKTLVWLMQAINLWTSGRKQRPCTEAASPLQALPVQRVASTDQLQWGFTPALFSEFWL
jgi:hypothetical protein